METRRCTGNDMEARVMRRVAWRLMPFLMLLYFVSFLDRVNIGFAALQMNGDVGLTPAQFGLGAGLFFVSYFLCEVPSNLILHRLGARPWIARVMVSWGVVSICTAFVQGPVSFYLLRLLLGAAEAGFFPGIILYLGYWFPSQRRAAMVATFMAAAPLSVALGSPLSGALLQINGLFGWRGWQWMFLLEGLPAILLGGVVLTWLTDRPQEARWLAKDERAWLIAAMAQEEARKPLTAHRRTALAALVDPRVLVLSLIYFGTSAGLYTLGIWAPQMLEGYGLRPFANGVLNAVPALTALIAMIVWSRHSDQTGERSWHVILPCLLAAGGLAAAAVATTIFVVVAALCVVNVGISASKPPLWSMPTVFLTGPAAAAGIAAINSIGNLGGFVGPGLIGWLKGATGGYSAGLACVAALLAFSALLTWLLARRDAPR